MGGAIIVGMIKKLRLPARKIYVCDIDKPRLLKLKKSLKVNIAADNRLAAAKADIIILAVKPQQMKAVLEEIAPVLRRTQMIISIAAGITTKFIERRLAGKIPVIRSMPNTPLQIGLGMTVLCRGKYASRNNLKTAEQLFSALGKTLIVERESLMDAVTAVSGSGPAYVYLFVEALLAAARKLGLADKQAQILVSQTLAGANQLLVCSGKNAAELRRQVTSPGGTTEAAMRVFRQKRFQAIVSQAVQAACRRSKALSK